MLFLVKKKNVGPPYVLNSYNWLLHFYSLFFKTRKNVVLLLIIFDYINTDCKKVVQVRFLCFVNKFNIIPQASSSLLTSFATTQSSFLLDQQQPMSNQHSVQKSISNQHSAQQPITVQTAQQPIMHAMQQPMSVQSSFNQPMSRPDSRMSQISNSTLDGAFQMVRLLFNG